MAFGVEVFNDAGDLVINEEYANYIVIANGRSANGAHGWSASTTGDDIVWVRPHTTGGYLYYDRNTYGEVVSSTGFVDWVVTRRNPNGSSATFGLQIYSSSGAIAYDSGRAACVPVMNARDSASESFTPQTPDDITSTTVSAPFAPAPSRRRFVPLNCFEEFIRWLTSGSNAYTQSSKLTWTTESSFSMSSVANLVGPSAGVIYAKETGRLNYFWADFVI